MLSNAELLSSTEHCWSALRSAEPLSNTMIGKYNGSYISCIRDMSDTEQCWAMLSNAEQWFDGSNGTLRTLKKLKNLRWDIPGKKSFLFPRAAADYVGQLKKRSFELWIENWDRKTWINLTIRGPGGHGGTQTLPLLSDLTLWETTLRIVDLVYRVIWRRERKAWSFELWFEVQNSNPFDLCGPEGHRWPLDITLALRSYSVGSNSPICRPFWQRHWKKKKNTKF